MAPQTRPPECEVMPVMGADLVLWSRASELDFVRFDQVLVPNNQPFVMGNNASR